MLPARPALLPGVPVVRRDEQHLQVGIDPPRRAVVDDDPDVRHLLAALRVGAAPAPVSEAGHRALTRLADAGLLDDLDRRDERSAARGRVTVGVDAPADLTQPVVDRLRAVGLTGTTGAAQPGVVLVLRDGPVPRRHLDRWVREGTPHLLLETEPGATTVGPFVEPGRTACVRCVDAHLELADPRRALLLEQVDVAVPRDPALHAVALAWAASDLVAWAEGRSPSTWSATVRIDADLDVRRLAWGRHPGCGCAWDSL
jgi:hypothetical protein